MAFDGPWTHRRLHLIGVGGAGMSGYARVSAQLGATVSGSDRADGPALAALRQIGVDVHVGHDAANVPGGADVEVVYSSAVPADNPERAAARERGLREVPRAELLAELSALRRVIAIAGAHGKTTTTSMAAHVLLRCGADPAYLIGGALTTTGLNADWPADGDWLVVEADESDRSMLRLDVDVAVVTNVELDHHATYASLEEVRDVFREFLDGPAAAVIWDRPDLLALRPPGAPVVPFDATDVELTPGGSRFSWRGQAVRLAVPGEHNARNAIAALEACLLAGVPEADAAAALADFGGAGRRFDRVGETAAGVPVIDDYAHHPTEVAATLRAARSYEARVVAVFQPHLFSRTEQLHREFGKALALADVACVLPVYPARETQEDFPGVTGLLIAEATCDARPGMPVLWLPSFEAARTALAGTLRPGDLLICMGAGDIDGLARSLTS